MKYVIGIDLGTSAVKLLLVNQHGKVVHHVTKSYRLIQEKTGYSEQNPEDWVTETFSGLKQLLNTSAVNPEHIEGISFSGQMHGLVLLDENNDVLRNAILWNDLRTTEQCERINQIIGKERLLKITKNKALEGFTLPKLLWVQEQEKDIYSDIKTFLLPKDYVRFRMTGKLHTDYSDAAGTLMFDIEKNKWSSEICELLHINEDICPEIVGSHEEIGTITEDVASLTGLSPRTKVFAGGADNACGAVGAGILSKGKTLCSIGTSGVILNYEQSSSKSFAGKLHYFNHSDEGFFYTMGVTLSAGHSLAWFRNTFAKSESFDELLSTASSVPVGAEGLLFTPYITGERTPHANANIRGSFIGMDVVHERKHFVRSVLEGITFSLKESLEIMRDQGSEINEIISIGGGAQSEFWLQMQADIFNARIFRLSSEQGPGMGAAMLAAFGCQWFDSLQSCAREFLHIDKVYEPNQEYVTAYNRLFTIYQEVFPSTVSLSERLSTFRSMV